MYTPILRPDKSNQKQIDFAEKCNRVEIGIVTIGIVLFVVGVLPLYFLMKFL